MEDRSGEGSMTAWRISKIEGISRSISMGVPHRILSFLPLLDIQCVRENKQGIIVVSFSLHISNHLVGKALGIDLSLQANKNSK